MEPEQRFDRHVEHRREVVATSHVGDFVREDRVDLCWAESFGDAVWPHQYGRDDAEDPWFDGLRRRDEAYSRRVAFEASQRMQHGTVRNLRCPLH